MKGIITVYLNRDEFKEGEEKELIDLIRKNNVETLNKSKEAGFPIMFLTTTTEASHAEKCDLDKPYPLRNHVE